MTKAGAAMINNWVPPAPSIRLDTTSWSDEMTSADNGHLGPEQSSQPPPVVLLIDALANNGAVHIVVDLARRWSKSGARLAVVQRLISQREFAVPAEVRLEYLTKKPGRLSRSLPSSVVRLMSVARGTKAIVSGSEIGIGVVLGFLVARLTRKRFIISVHANLDDALGEWIPPRWHRVFYWIHRRADGAICVAPGVVPPLLRNGLPATRIRVVRNGIDIAAIQLAAQGPGGLIDSGWPVVVATGRLAHQKAYDVLIRAHAEVVGDHPHRILILNDGPERESLEQLAVELGVRESVDFAGAVSAPLPSVAQADVFCLPSRHEGLPLALLEAVALGVPCIATDSSEGVRAALDDGRVGDLIPVDDVAALAESLRRHFTDPSPLRAKAMLAPAHSRSFDSGAMANGWATAIRGFVD